MNFIRRLFCKHEWDMIFNVKVNQTLGGRVMACHDEKTFRCIKCGCEKKYKSN